MNPRAEKVLQNLESKKVGVFCDDSNLYHAYTKYGWRIDFCKFKKLLEKYCDLQFVNYYIAVPDKSDDSFSGTQKFLEKIRPDVAVKMWKLF